MIDDRLIESRGEDATSIAYTDVSAAGLAKILPRPDVKSRLINAMSGCTDLIGFNTSKPPFDDLKARHGLPPRLAHLARPLPAGPGACSTGCPAGGAGRVRCSSGGSSGPSPPGAPPAPRPATAPGPAPSPLGAGAAPREVEGSFRGDRRDVDLVPGRPGTASALQ
ncbi:hypothetical protein [Nonomuraea sp. NPDC052265]|uniref:hypothetical protein n=1 Tax=Nonomuraea sp. NPDC052265 TaxID=3364374 RepID=UPI0037C57CE3